MNKEITICPCCGEPIIWTFAFSGREYYCLMCGNGCGMLGGKEVEETKELQSQLKYLRSGEHLNQLRFERDMLQHIVDYNEVSKEDKEFIDMTHRNTELLEENQQLKEIHDKAIKFIKNHIQETTYKYVYSNEVNVIQELHLDNEELIELLEILERSDNN